MGVAVCENMQLASLNFASIYFNINHSTVIYVILILAFLKCHFKFFYMLMNNNCFLLLFHVSFVY